MNYLTKQTLLSNLEIIKCAVYNLSNLYEENEELNDIDLSNLFTMSLDELHLEYSARIEELQQSIKAI